MTARAPDAAAETLPGLEEQVVDVGGFKTFARIAAGPVTGRLPVVMVHGQGVSSRFEAPSAREFARDFPVYVPDQPGFGRSEGPRRALDVDQLGDFIAAFMSTCGIKRAALVATSFGCQVAVACAVRHPRSVAKLVLQGPAAAPSDRGTLRLVYLWWLNGRQEPPDLKLLASEYRAAGLRRVYKTFNHYRNYPIGGRLRQVEAPTLVVRGEKDKLVSQPWAERVAELLPMGRLTVVPGAAHTMSHFWPRQLADVARPFILDNQLSQ